MCPPADWVDYKTIKQTVQIDDVLKRYGITNLSRQGHDLVGPCPLHKGTSNSFHVSLRKNVWKCFSPRCNKGGNVIDLAQALEGEGTSFREAALKLQVWFNVEPSTAPPDTARRTEATGGGWKGFRRADEGARREGKPAGPVADNTSGWREQGSRRAQFTSTAGKRSDRTREPSNPQLTFALHLDSDDPALAEAGFTKETIERFGLGRAKRGLLKGYIAIPLHDELGQLVGYHGILPHEQQAEPFKYPPTLDRTGLLFNLHRLKPAPSHDPRERWNPIIVIPTPLEAIRLTQAGIEHVVGLLHTPITPGHIALLKKHTGLTTPKENPHHE